jgi:hypothetical protein
MSIRAGCAGTPYNHSVNTMNYDRETGTIFDIEDEPVRLMNIVALFGRLLVLPFECAWRLYRMARRAAH